MRVKVIFYNYMCSQKEKAADKTEKVREGKEK